MRKKTPQFRPVPPAMTVFGIGPQFSSMSLLFAALVYGLCAGHAGGFPIAFLPSAVRVGLGVILIALGVPGWILSGVKVVKGFHAGRLCTSGLYGFCRHPLYASWCVLIVPGIVLLTNNWTAFIIPLFMCALVLMLVREEETWLGSRFGTAYRAYRKRVPALLPLGWIR